MESEKTIKSDNKKEPTNASPEKKGFLSLSLFLLLQGQFVSVMGDIISLNTLGFWVLALTGSSALMGT